MQSGHIIRKKDLEKLDSFYFCFFTYKSLNYWIYTQCNKWLVYDMEHLQISNTTSATLNI